jgi:hypothetical protein
MQASLLPTAAHISHKPLCLGKFIHSIWNVANVYVNKEQLNLESGSGTQVASWLAFER